MNKKGIINVQLMFNDIIQHSCFGKPLYEPSVTLKNAKSSIGSFYDQQGNGTEMVAMKTGSDTSGIIMNKWLIIQIDIKYWY